MQHRKAWLGAFLTFGVGDLVTTYYGLQLRGVKEMHPTANVFLQAGGFENLIIAKLVVIVTTLFIWGISDEDWTLAVPITLIIIGTFITTWNILVIITATA